MISVISITSLDQGNLFKEPASEDEYYARFTATAEKADGVGPGKVGTKNFLRLLLAGRFYQKKIA